MNGKRSLPILTVAAGMLLLVDDARPDGACCFDDGGCVVVLWTTCESMAGRYVGSPTDCDDTDHDGIADDCRAGPFAVEYPKVYWLDGSGSEGKIQRANLDGTLVETPIPHIGWPAALTISTRAGMLFWVEVADGNYTKDSIRRARLDGTEVVTILVESVVDRLAVDEVSGKLYWITDGTIKRANLDGTNIELVLSGNEATDLAVVHDPRKACTYVDADADGDVDLYDFAAFQECFSD